jgi:hypothetical protein
MIRAMLTPFDELTCHQAVSTFDAPQSSDRAWTEKMWFNLHDVRGRVVLASGIGVYPNRNVMDGFACLNVHHEQQVNLRLSRELRPRIADLQIGPLTVQVLEPFKRIRLALDESSHGFSYELELIGRVPPHEELPQFGRNKGRVFVHTCRYAQLGRARGVIRLDGKSWDVKEDEWYAQRDHSWGIRLGVGQHEPGIQTSDVATFNSLMINWLTAQFDDWAVYYYLIEKATGKVDFLSGAVVRGFGDDSVEIPITAVEHDFKYHDASARMQSGRVVLHCEDGAHVELQMRELNSMYLRGGAYAGFKGYTHGTYMGPSWSDGERFELARPGCADEVHGLDDTVCEYRSGNQVGYGIIENMILPPFPKYGFGRL